MKEYKTTGHADVVRGDATADRIDGKNGDDQLFGMGGNDELIGGKGDDRLDGGSGNDRLDGGEGNDLLVHVAAENRGAADVYLGGSGTDTLRLVLTAAEWDREGVRQDVHRLLAHLGRGDALALGSLGVTVSGVERLEVVVDGKTIDAADRGVTARADALALGEDDAAGVTLDVLANDLVADGVRSVTIAQPARGRVELVSTAFAGATPSAVLRFTPGDAFQHLKQGETATETFSYTVVDKDGDAKTATVTVTVTGTNDAPVAVADTAVVSEDGIVSGDVSTNDSDVDAGAFRFFVTDFLTTPRGFQMSGDGRWTFDPTQSGQFDDLRAGETRTVEIGYLHYDDEFEPARSTLTITVTGVNDAPTIAEVDGFYIPEDGVDLVPGTVFVREGSILVADPDGEGLGSVTLLAPPEGHLGRLVLTDYADGRAGWRFEADADAILALEEGEELIQTYTVVITDGQGATSVETFDLFILGDGNDDVSLVVEPGDLGDAGFAAIGVARVYVYDEDEDDVHSISVRWTDPDAVGEIAVTSELKQGFFGRYYEVTYRIPADSLPFDGSSQAFEVFASDGNGSETVSEGAVRFPSSYRAVGDASDQSITGYDDGDRDVLIGGGGADQLLGGGGRDLLYGDGIELIEEGDDFRAGGEWSPVAGFDDELNGGAGADTLVGGAGADRFVLTRGQTDGERILDFSAAEGDRLDFVDWGAGATVTAFDDGRWEVATADRSTVEVFVLADGVMLTADDYLFTERDVVWQIGGDEDDIIWPADGDVGNVLVGNGGADFLLGGDRADELYGDEGPTLPDGEVNVFDPFDSSPGVGFDDDLNGGGGADLLAGGAGADTFEFQAGETDGDVVLDFDAGEGDRLDLTDWGPLMSFARLDATRWVVTDIDGVQEVITFANAAQITRDDVIMFGDFIG